MASEAGKGSKPRPYSVTNEQFVSNWDLIFMKNKPIKLVNPLNQEQWICDDFSNVKLVEGIEYVTVYKPESPSRMHLMRKEALRKFSNG
jgi:hypothetical protein